MNPSIILSLFLSLFGFAAMAGTSEERDFSAEFGTYSGAFVLYDAAQDRWVRYHPEQCRMRTTPCSTFKVLNSLIALETGVASGPEFSLKWDGTQHPIKAWNRDQTLRSAFSDSCLWYFEALAARAGKERLQKFVTAADYGNLDTSGGLPHFWLESSLTISPDEQVEFLRRLHARKLPFAGKTVDTVLDIMTLPRQGPVTFRGKTGTAGDPVKGVATLGWFIGSVTTPSGDYFFATRITGGENPSGRTARKITESILTMLKILPAQVIGSRAGDERTVAGVSLCWCPPGKFIMGSPPGESGRRSDEAQVEVNLTRGFWMGKYEVTQSQWKKIAGEIPGKLIAGEGDDFPVYWVSFIAAEEFCRKLTEQARASGELPAGWEFRLPTEAQWEYACRAGTTSAFSFGDTLTSQQANIGKPYDGTPDGTPGAAASKVGSYPANLWGLHDMHGNEFELCLDWYHDKLPGGTDPDLSARKGVANRDGTYSRVRRGGAWTDDEKFCRSALRLRYEPERNADHIGFRVVVVQP